MAGRRAYVLSETDVLGQESRQLLQCDKTAETAGKNGGHGLH